MGSYYDFGKNTYLLEKCYKQTKQKEFIFVKLAYSWFISSWRRYPGGGTWYLLVPCHYWYQVPIGTCTFFIHCHYWYLVPCTWYQVPGTPTSVIVVFSPTHTFPTCLTCKSQDCPNLSDFVRYRQNLLGGADILQLIADFVFIFLFIFANLWPKLSTSSTWNWLLIDLSGFPFYNWSFARVAPVYPSHGWDV